VWLVWWVQLAVDPLAVVVLVAPLLGKLVQVVVQLLVLGLLLGVQGVLRLVELVE
jgi:hypothetical protein